MTSPKKRAPLATPPGLPGKCPRPIAVTVLGAGSMFTPRLVNDILQIPGNAGGEIRLVDIDRNRLAMMRRLIAALLELLGKGKWRVTASTERRKLLRGSHYIVNCIEVSGT